MILGVDPGLGGALALLERDGSLQQLLDMPTLDGEVSAVGLLEIPTGDIEGAVIEWVHLMPKIGTMAARSMGMSLATVHTWLTVRGVPTTRVAPSVWKRAMGLSSDKDQSRALACRLWPKDEPSFKRKKDADRAEAALIAYWWLTKGAGSTLVYDRGPRGETPDV